MTHVTSLTHRAVWRLRLLATMLAVAGQLGLTGAALTLARDEASAVVHVEQSGIDIHRGHNEATCAACASLSFHAKVSAASPPVSSEEIGRAAPGVRCAVRLSGPNLLSNSCRAPPREV
jgi:hypothetical protein